MCGRFTLTAQRTDIQAAFPDVEVPIDLAPRYNIAPSQPIAVIANTGVHRMELYRWGLIPSWTRDPAIGDRMINARAETLPEKAAFRGILRRRRCLIVADGFYEWQAQPGGRPKQPMYVRLASGQPFAFAGLWDQWQPAEGEPVRSCTIITTSPNALLQMIHNRMPVILSPDAYAQWLDPAEQPAESLARYLVPFPPELMTVYPVSRYVNSPQNEGPACVAPASG